jgi:AraC-like DNA-binding protein
MTDFIDEIPAYSIESLRTVSTEEEARDFEFFRFEYFAKDIEHLKAPHRHSFYTFILVTGGGGSHDIDFTTYDLKPNRLFLIAPGQVHAWNQLINVKGFVVLFTDGFVALSKGRKLMSNWPLFRLDQPCYIDLSTAESESWQEELRFMESEAKLGDNFSRDAIFYSIGTLLVRASRLYIGVAPDENLNQDLLFVFQELIEKNYVTMRAPKDYAALLNITPNHLNAICKKKSGKSAGGLIRQRVLLEAKRLLAHTKLSVAEIAYQLNFVDNSYFGRYFKKYLHITPERFRKQFSG